MILTRIWALVLALAIAVSTLSGCVFSGGKEFVSLMEKVPIAATSYAYWNVGTMGEDSQLWALFEVFKDSPYSKQITDLGLARSSVKHMAGAYGFGEYSNSSVRILKGAFSDNDVNTRLAKYNYLEEEYEKLGVWAPPDSEYNYLSLEGGRILMGCGDCVKACIDTLSSGDSYSLYEDQNIKSVADRLPGGIIVELFDAGAVPEEAYADLVVFGRSFRKLKDGSLELKAIYMFQDTYSAGQSSQAIDDHLAGNRYTVTKVVHSGSFIEVTANIAMDDYLQGCARNIA